MLYAWCSWSRVCLSSCASNWAVSLEQYRAAVVPVESLAAWLLELELEHCWIYTSLGVLLQLVSIELGSVYPWLLELRWLDVLLAIDSKIQSYVRTSTTRRSSRHTSRLVLDIRTIWRLLTSSSTKMSTSTSSSTATYSWPTSTLYFMLDTQNLYQHIHLHQQATGAINFKITSCLLLGAKWQDQRQLQGRVPTSEPLPPLPSWSRLMNPRDKEHPASTQERVITTSRVWAQPADISTSVVHQHRWAHLGLHRRAYRQEHLWEDPQPTDQQYTSVWSDINQWASQQQCSQPRQPLQPRDRLAHGTSPHCRLLPAHVAHRQVTQVAGAGYIGSKDNNCYIWFEARQRFDNQHHPLERCHHHHQAQRQNGSRLTSEDTSRPQWASQLPRWHRLGQSTFSAEIWEQTSEGQGSLHIVEYICKA